MNITVNANVTYSSRSARRRRRPVEAISGALVLKKSLGLESATWRGRERVAREEEPHDKHDKKNEIHTYKWTKRGGIERG